MQQGEKMSYSVTLPFRDSYPDEKGCMIATYLYDLSPEMHM